MGLDIAFEIPGVPVAKGRPRMTIQNGYARAYTPHKTREYEQTVKHLASQAMRGTPPTDAAVSLEIMFYLPIPASASKKNAIAMSCGLIRPAVKPDIDNAVKSILDGLNGIIFKDDKQVVTLNAMKAYNPKPRVVVIVREIYN